METSYTTLQPFQLSFLVSIPVNCKPNLHASTQITCLGLTYCKTNKSTNTMTKWQIIHYYSLTNICQVIQFQTCTTIIIIYLSTKYFLLTKGFVMRKLSVLKTSLNASHLSTTYSHTHLTTTLISHLYFECAIKPLRIVYAMDTSQTTSLDDYPLLVASYHTIIGEFACYSPLQLELLWSPYPSTHFTLQHVVYIHHSYPNWNPTPTLYYIHFTLPCMVVSYSWMIGHIMALYSHQNPFNRVECTVVWINRLLSHMRMKRQNVSNGLRVSIMPKGVQEPFLADIEIIMNDSICINHSTSNRKRLQITITILLWLIQIELSGIFLFNICIKLHILLYIRIHTIWLQTNYVYAFYLFVYTSPDIHQTFSWVA